VELARPLQQALPVRLVRAGRSLIPAEPGDEKLSDQLEGWLRGPQPKTVGSLVELFGEKSFAVLFVILLAVPALPLPTGGVTHAFELIAMLLALELIVGRPQVWLPERWRRRELGPAMERRGQLLVGRIRWLERHSRARLGFLFSWRLAGVGFGIVVLLLTAAAFLAPPFTGLDTLPALGVVLISVGFLLEDALLAIAGTAVGVAGVVLAIVLGEAAIHGLRNLL
jgi:hypothetical protein